MRESLPLVTLREVLQLSIDAVPINPSATYSMAGVYSFGRGLFARYPLHGTQTTYKVMHRLHEDDFVLSQLKGWEGALARVSGSFDGWFLSPQFPTFRAVEERIDITYFDWYCKQPILWDLLRAMARGMGARRDTVSPQQFLSIQIALPPLEEQLRIVARIEELAAKIAEARKLRREADAESDAVCQSIIFDERNGPAMLTSMRELVRLRETDVVVHREETYDFAGVYSFGRGVFRGPRKKGLEFSYPRLTRLHAKDFVYPKLMAWEGALGIVPSECRGLCVSPEFPVFEVDESRVLPEVLDVYFRTPSVWPILSGASTGTNVRRRRLNPTNFLSYKMPVPSMQTQLKVRVIKSTMDRLKQLRAETARELDALLPAILDKAFKGEL